MINAFKKMAGFEKPAVVMPVVRPAPGFAGWPDRKPGLAGGTAHLPARDARWVQKLIDKAAQSPTGCAALAWAAAYGLRFEVGAYPGALANYMPGTGTLYLRREWMAQADAASLVHEIRHAWQDYHGLVPSFTQQQVLSGDLGLQLIQQALLEADAYAHDVLLRREMSKGPLSPAAQKDELTRGFTSWFFQLSRGYHVRGLRRVATAQRIEEIEAVLQKSVEPQVKKLQAGIDPWSRSAANQLGRSFAGVNYLSCLTREDREHFRVIAQTPAVALAAFNLNAPRAAYTGQENALRKIQLRERLKAPLKRLPLPE